MIFNIDSSSNIIWISFIIRSEEQKIFSIGIRNLNMVGWTMKIYQIRYYCTNPNNKSVDKKDMGLDNPNLQQLNEIFLINLNRILIGMISNSKITNVKCYLQKVWGNHNINEDICIPHTHRVVFCLLIIIQSQQMGEYIYHFPGH